MIECYYKLLIYGAELSIYVDKNKEYTLKRRVKR